MGELIDGIKALPRWVHVILAVVFTVFVVIPVILITTPVFNAAFVEITDGSPDPENPGTELTFEHTAETNTLTITYVDGKSLPKNETYIQVNDRVNAWGETGEITPGETISLSEIEQGDTITVIRETPDNKMETLATHSINK